MNAKVRHYFTIFLGLLILSWAANRNSFAKTELPSQWQTEWPAALSRAKDRKQPVLAMVSASWCPPCHMMKQSVLTRGDVQNELNNWVPVYLDESKNRELISKLRITGFPTFVFLNAVGEEVGRQAGGMSAEDFISLLQRQRDFITRGFQLQKEIKKHPQDPRAYKALGDLLDKAGKYEDASKIYERGAAFDPANHTGIKADVLYARALLMSTGHPDQARALLEKIEKDFPGSPRVGDSLFLRGLIANDKNDKAGARAFFQKYLDHYPEGERARVVREFLPKLK